MSGEYKLLPEIKNFILEHKKAYPQISCRKLASVAQDKFQVKISKSSINAIIKEAGLSDRIGRKSLKAKPALTKTAPETKSKAQSAPIQALPEPKTKAFLPEPEPTPSSEPIKEPEPLPKPEPEPIPEPIAEQKSEPESKPIPEPLPEQKPEPKPEPIPEPEVNPHPELPVKPEPIPEPVEIKPVKVFAEAGFYIFQAADLALGGLDYILQLCRLPGQDEKQISEIYAELAKGVFTKDITALKKYPEPRLSGDISQSLNQICQQLPRKLDEIRSFKITLDDGRNFYIDAEFNSLWPTNNIAREFCANIGWAKANLVDRLKNKGILLLSAPLDLKQLDNLFTWMKVPAEKIEIMAEGTRVISAMEDTILDKRNFIFAALPQQLERSLKIRSSKEELNLVIQRSREEFQVIESEIELSASISRTETKIRMFALKRPGQAKPFICLYTNFTSEEADAQTVVLRFLEAWPDPLFAFNDLDKKNELFTYALERRFPIYPDRPSLNWEDILAFWNNALNIYCLRHFTIPEEGLRSLDVLKEKFYDLKAEIESTEKYSLVRLILPEKYAFRKELEYLIKRMNQKCLFDLNNRRLWFALA
ncbi:MAG: hypothetical protein PHU91_05775 [Candidatus Omnitrophica bacterium]|nr:hypothetical protein [Candidatus Omnitrophota bacterium]